MFIQNLIPLHQLIYDPTSSVQDSHAIKDVDGDSPGEGFATAGRFIHHSLPLSESIADGCGTVSSKNPVGTLSTWHHEVTLFCPDEKIRQCLETLDHRLIAVEVVRATDGFEVTRILHIEPDTSLAEASNIALSPTRREVETTVQRAKLLRQIRAFFYARDFLEVETPCFVESAGTDPALSAVNVAVSCSDKIVARGQLRTSPELEMKRLLCAGADRIFQIGPVWRAGELGDMHHPEFTMLEWYRAWDSVESIMQDVEGLVRDVLGAQMKEVTPIETTNPSQRHPLDLTGDFQRVTFANLIDQLCGFDIRDCISAPQLLDAMQQCGIDLSGFNDPSSWTWMELFSLLIVERVDPWLATQGAIFLTEWPANAAILAARSPDDPRVAQRFELYIAGVELANGFGELTDYGEQKDRFLADLDERRSMGIDEAPLPTRFLESLMGGMPPSGGVALGLDRLLMLKTGVSSIQDVLPFALRRRFRNDENVQWWEFK